MGKKKFKIIPLKEPSAASVFFNSKFQMLNQLEPCESGLKRHQIEAFSNKAPN